MATRALGKVHPYWVFHAHVGHLHDINACTTMDYKNAPPMCRFRKFRTITIGFRNQILSPTPRRDFSQCLCLTR